MKSNRQLLVFFTLLLSVFSAKSQDITGSWKGTLKVQGMEMPLIFHISQEDNVLKSTMDSPTQGATGIPMDETTFTDNTLTILFKQAGIKYTASLEGETLSGTFNQGGNALPLTLTKTVITLPGNPDLVSSEAELKALSSLSKGKYKYSVEDYFSNPKGYTFRFSPNGKYLSYRERDENGKQHVYVKNVETGEANRVIVESEELIRGYGWLNHERLYYVMDKGGDENNHIYAINLDGSNDKDLTPFDGVKANFSELLKEDKDHIIVELNKNNPQVFEPYKLNVVTGEITQLFTNNDVKNPISGYQFDKDGNLRGYTKLKDGVFNDLYYEDGEGGFKFMKQLSWKDKFGIIAFDYSTEYAHDAYVVSNLESDKSEILLCDLKKLKVIKKVFSNPNYDVSSMGLSKKNNYAIDYFSYEGEKNVIIPVSDTYKKIDAKVNQVLPNMQYYVLDKTEDETKFMLYVTSDKLYGIYYAYDLQKDELKEIYNTMPQLNPDDMAEMRPISFTSRDGVTIHGYITLPKAALNGEKVPVIVNPHGGPQGVRDSWGFNPEAQLFASRGYATLQVNFRISGGYGRAFLESGFKQIGRKAMDDVEDGLKYVIDKGWVDGSKAAIYGASHGGFAVLRGLTKTPDLYACGVDYVGVSNLFTFMKSMPAYWKPYLKIIKEIWYDEDVAEEKLIMEEVSPVYNIDKIKKPLFVVQGANDPRVNIDESDQIVSGLRARNVDVPYMVKYDEGHGFGKEENTIELYKAMLGFYAKHLKEKQSEPIKD